MSRYAVDALSILSFALRCADCKQGVVLVLDAADYEKFKTQVRVEIGQWTHAITEHHDHFEVHGVRIERGNVKR